MSPQAWLRFEKKKTDGTVLKLRIQDLPPSRIAEATELLVKYFVTEEPYRKAIGFTKNPKALEEYKEYIDKRFRNSASRNVMCCADTDEENPAMMGVTSIGLVSNSHVAQSTSKETQEMKLMHELLAENTATFDVLKNFNIPAYYTGQSMLVVPDYRGYGISEKFLTVGRLMCAAHGVPLIAAWMTSLGTQIAAHRNGWETVCELERDDAARRHGITLVDAPPTNKLCVAGPHPEYSSIMAAQENVDDGKL